MLRSCSFVLSIVDSVVISHPRVYRFVSSDLDSFLLDPLISSISFNGDDHFVKVLRIVEDTSNLDPVIVVFLDHFWYTKVSFIEILIKENCVDSIEVSIFPIVIPVADHFEVKVHFSSFIVGNNHDFTLDAIINDQVVLVVAVVDVIWLQKIGHEERVELKEKRITQVDEVVLLVFVIVYGGISFLFISIGDVLVDVLVHMEGFIVMNVPMHLMDYVVISVVHILVHSNRVVYRD